MLTGWLTTAQAAERLGINQKTVGYHIRAGHLPAVRSGARYFRLRETDVDADKARRDAFAPMRQPQPCGTPAAYQRHNRRKEDCQDCLDAWRADQQAKRAAETRHCSQGCDAVVACKGWCRACYERWLDAGRPEDGPPPKLEVSAKREDYLFLRAQGEIREVAAQRAGASLTWTYTWEPGHVANLQEASC